MTEIPENTRALLAENPDHLFDTPDEVTAALLRAHRFPTLLWEPCAGRLAIVRQLRAAGYLVYATDLVPHPGLDEDRMDFLMMHKLPVIDGKRIEGIITNPPYKLANQFVQHALDLEVPVVAMFLRLGFLEGDGRVPLLDDDDAHFAQVMPFIDRVPMMHRPDYEGPKLKKSRLSMAWFLWDRTRTGPATVLRIRCDVPVQLVPPWDTDRRAGA